MAHPLDKVNLTELIQTAREAENTNLGRNLSRRKIYEALEEGAPSNCPLEEKRKSMETHIKKNYRRLRTQLPGCDGKCVTFGCPDIIVQRCWEMMKDDML